MRDYYLVIIMKTKLVKIKKLLQKAVVEALEKAVELLILAVLVGAAAKYVFAAIPAVLAASIITGIVNEKIL